MIRPLPLLLILIILHSVSQTGWAQGWQWGKQPIAIGQPSYQSAGEGWSVATDASGNVYEAGAFEYGTMVYGSDSLVTTLNEDMFIVKYDASGNYKWAQQGRKFDSNSFLFSASVAVDRSGFVYMGGFYGDTVIFGMDTLIPSVAGSSEIYLVKYDPDGNIVWVRQSNINLSKDGVYTIGNTCFGVATDASNNVYITGNFHNITSFNGVSVSDVGSVNGNVFVVKYDGIGNVLWSRQGQLPSTAAYASGQAVATDALGNLFVTGYFHDTISFGTNVLISQSDRTDIFVVKYGPDGAVLWARQTTSTNDLSWASTPIASGNSIATDNAGNVYVAGNFADDVTFGSYTLLNPIAYSYSFAFGDMFLAKYNADGQVMWAEQGEPLTNATYSSWGIAADTFGHIYFTGGGMNYYNQTKLKYSIKFGSSTFTFKDSTSLECTLLVELDTSGNVMCGAIIQTGGDDIAPVTTDPTGTFVYLGGDYLRQHNNIITGPDTLDGPDPTITSAEVGFIARWLPCNPPIPLSAGILKTNDSCTGTCSGMAIAIPSGGTPPYTYLWSTLPADTAQTITGLCMGGYRVTVTDAVGTTAVSAVTITQLQAIAGNIKATGDTLCAGDTANLFATGVFGNIQWQSSIEGSTFANIPGAGDSVYSFSTVQTASYRVIAVNGACSDTTLALRLVVNPLSVPVITSADSLICSNDSTQICALNNFVSYLWNIMDTTKCTTGKQAGDYYVTVTDVNGCSAESNHVAISVYPAPSVSIIQNGDTLSSFGQVSYQWLLNGNPISNAAGSFYIANGAGAYSVEVTDSDGCEATSNAIVVTGSEDLGEGGNLHLYPNPFTDIICITTNGTEAGIKDIAVYDMTGRMVFSKKPGSTVAGALMVDASLLAKGVYYLKVITGVKEYTQKVVKI